MLVDGSRCRRQLKPRCIAATAAQGPDMVIKILWNECRQPLVALYRYGRSAVEGDKDTLSLWRPCASAWVSRMKEVIDTTIELQNAGFSSLPKQEHWQSSNASAAVLVQPAPAEGGSSWTEALCHLQAHVLCLAMASALCYKNHALMQRMLQIEKEPQGLEQLSKLLDSVLEDVQADSSSLSSPAASPMNSTMPLSPTSPSSPRKTTVAYPIQEQIWAQIALYVCAALRQLLLRVIGEDIHAPSLKTLQVLACVDAWQHGYEKVATSGSARQSGKLAGINLDADRVEDAYLHDYGGELCTEEGSSLWCWLRQHPDVAERVTYAKHSAWGQIKTRWNTGARFFVLERGMLGIFTVGEAEANYSDQAAWSPLLKHYTAVDAGQVEGLFKITIAPLSHKAAFELSLIHI
eukprot:TRINITY_DN22080_c0_g1_i1.p1 TRINITY_DN22080_c0_g1~~TRINITY_DN22080_c0_g1_i1.p1  ORF type:complete len:406 (-),score=98.84 TRINITY_DN22080_c0_g1_i1:88-1305(-)